MKSKIYIKQWLDLKPQNYNGKTDVYYLNIANKMYCSIETDKKLLLLEFMDEDDIANLCCFLTCYYEDVISQTNIWHAFKSLYAETYKKPLPFYNTDEKYNDEEINVEDVAFLIWYYLNTIQDEKFLNPYKDFILDIAKQVMKILDDDYEFAPENEALKKSYQLNQRRLNSRDEFYEMRKFLNVIFFESYLLYPDIKNRLDVDVFETLAEFSREESHNVLPYIMMASETYTFNKSSALLALNAKDWAMAVDGECDAQHKAISSISQLIRGLFFYKSQSETDVTLEHIASGMLFEMTKKSFDNLEDLKKDLIISIGLVRYKNEWWFSGSFSTIPFDADIVSDQKNSAEARSEVDFLEDKKQKEVTISKQKKSFLDFNNGSLIAFLTDAEVDVFLDAYIKYYNNSQTFFRRTKKWISKGTKADGHSGKTDGIDTDKGAEELTVVFFNPKAGIELYGDIHNAFPDENNPFFSEESQEDIEYILMSQNTSTEFTNYFVEHYKDQLEYFKTEPYKSYLNDLDFLLRFWKNDTYKTEKAMLLTR